MNLDHLPQSPGVYLFTHRKTGDTYVGASGQMRGRAYSHLHSLRRGKHPNKMMQALVAEHGVDFDIAVVELTDLSGCTAAEARCMKRLAPTLNLNKSNPSAKWRGQGRVPLGGRIKRSLHDALLEIAEAENRSLSQVVEFAVREYVERHGKKQTEPKRR